MFCFFLTNLIWNIFSFYFLVYFISFSVFLKYRECSSFLYLIEILLIYLIYYFFWYLYFIYFNYFLLVSLINWIICKLFCKFSIKSWEYIPKVFSCKKYNFYLNLKSTLKSFQLSLYFWVHLIWCKLLSLRIVNIGLISCDLNIYVWCIYYIYLPLSTQNIFKMNNRTLVYVLNIILT